MADKDRDDAEAPSLEMPSLGGMLRRRKGKEAATPEPVAEPQPVAEPEAVAPPLFADENATDGEDTAPTSTAAGSPVHESSVDTSVETVAGITATRTPGRDEDVEADDEPPAKRRREIALPEVPSPVAAALTGTVVGLLAVGLTWLGLEGCELTKGTRSCGGVGLLMLLLILAAMVALGAAMLKAWGIPDATSTSVLAVGLIAVICLLFLIGVLMSTWMLLVIPLVGAATYALAHAVTGRYADSG